MVGGWLGVMDGCLLVMGGWAKYLANGGLDFGCYGMVWMICNIFMYESD